MIKNKLYYSLPIVILTFIVYVFLGSCATIPKEAPELSESLGKRISSLQDAHITLLKKFFDQKRDDVDQFLEEEWLPMFTEKFFSDEKISAAWNQIVSDNNTEDRLKFLTLIGPKLQEKINNKRKELNDPLNKLEDKIETKLRSEYDQALAINNSITGFLYSANKVEENRQRYMDMLGVTQQKVDSVINKTDDIVTDLTGKAEQVQEVESQIQKFIEQLKALKDSSLN